MSITIRPLSAILDKDTDAVGKAVTIFLYVGSVCGASAWSIKEEGKTM